MVALLSCRTWYNIRLSALANGIRFNTKQSKDEGYEQVRGALLNGQLEKSYRTLTDAEREPLLALQLADGAMPLYRFTEHFGIIRPYKPWRDDFPRFPWKRPASSAEKLWHLGMIEIQSNTVLLPDEVAALLPPLPAPVEIKHAPSSDLRGVFLRDLAVFYALGIDRRKRWLSLNQQRQINCRLHVPDQPARSERLRFLHYMYRLFE